MILIKSTLFRTCIYLTEHPFISSLFLGFGKESLSSFLIIFYNILERGSLILFLLFVFVLLERSALSPYQSYK